MDLLSVEVFSTRFLILVFLMTGVLSILTAIAFSLGAWISLQRAQIITSFFLFVQLVLLVWGAMVSGAVEPTGWTMAWIPSLHDVGSIDVGMLENKPSLLIAALPFLLGLLVMLRASRVSSAEDGNKFLLGLVLSSFGSGLAWLGSTAWSVFPAAFVVLVGSMLGAGKSIRMQPEENYSGGFLGRQYLGLGVASVGLAALAGGGAALLFMKTGATAEASSLGVFGVVAVILGIVLLFGGVPTGLWNEISGDQKRAGRFILFQIYIGFSVFALASRLEPLFREGHVFKYGCWFVFAMSALLQVVGLFQERKASALGIWLVSGGLAAVAALGLGGPNEGVLLFLSTGLAAFSILLSPQSPVANWFVLTVGGGLIGTVTASAWVGWISTQLQETFVPGVIVAFLFGLRTVLFSKVVFLDQEKESDDGQVWYAWVPVSIALLFLLALIWQGSVVGGVIPDFSDHVFEGFLGSASHAPGQNQSGALGIYLSSWVIFTSIGVWLSRSRASVWGKLRDTLPRFTAFIMSGFGIDQVLLRFVALVGKMSVAIERGVEKQISNEFIPRITEKVVQGVANICLKTSAGLTAGLEGAAKNAVSAPAQMARLVQSGSIQWYLLFGFLVGMAIFLHFILLVGGN